MSTSPSVYLVWSRPDFADSELIACYSSKESAEAMRDRLEARQSLYATQIEKWHGNYGRGDPPTMPQYYDSYFSVEQIQLQP